MNERWREQAAAYALDALDAEERARFEARLTEDLELRRLVDEYREAAAGIGRGVERREPPDGLRQRVLRRTGETAPNGGTVAGRIDPATKGPGGPTDSESRPGTRWNERRGPGVSRLAWVALAAAVAGLVWVGLENRALQLETARLEAEMARVRASLGEAEADLARLDSIAPVLAGTDVRFATLTGEGAQPGLRLLWSPERNALLVAARNLPAPLEGRTYQLWGIRGTQSPVSLGTFRTEADGSVLVMISLDVDDAEFDLSAITEEPAGGSPQPTSDPFLAGPWRSAQE